MFNSEQNTLSVFLLKRKAAHPNFQQYSFGPRTIWVWQPNSTLLLWLLLLLLLLSLLLLLYHYYCCLLHEMASQNFSSSQWAYSVQHVYSAICVQYNMCTVQYVYSTICVQYNMCTVQYVYSAICVQYNMCTVQYERLALSVFWAYFGSDSRIYSLILNHCIGHVDPRGRAV